MNWTGGRLQRSRRSGTAISAQQRAYFARARARLQQGHTTTIPPRFSILEEYQPGYELPHDVQENPNTLRTSWSARQSQTAQRPHSIQRKLDEFSTTASVVTNLASMKSRHANQARTRGASRRPEASKLTAVSYSQRSFQDIGRVAEDTADTATIEDADEEELNARRLALLRRPNWLNLPKAKPLAITFDSFEDKQLIGRRRKLRDEDVPLTAKRFRSENDLLKPNQPMGSANAKSDYISVRVGSSIHGSQCTTGQHITPARNAPIDTFSDRILFTSKQENTSPESMLFDTVDLSGRSQRGPHDLQQQATASKSPRLLASLSPTERVKKSLRPHHILKSEDRLKRKLQAEIHDHDSTISPRSHKYSSTFPETPERQAPITSGGGNQASTLLPKYSTSHLNQPKLLQATTTRNTETWLGNADRFVSRKTQTSAGTSQKPPDLTYSGRLVFPSSPRLETPGALVLAPHTGRSVSSNASILVEPSELTRCKDFGSDEEEWRGFLDVGMSSDIMLDNGPASSDVAEHGSKISEATNMAPAAANALALDEVAASSSEFIGFSQDLVSTGSSARNRISNCATPNWRIGNKGAEFAPEVKEETMKEAAKSEDDAWYKFVFGHEKDGDSDPDDQQYQSSKRYTSQDSLAAHASDVHASELLGRSSFPGKEESSPTTNLAPPHETSCHSLVVNASSSPDVLAFSPVGTAPGQAGLPRKVVFTRPVPFAGTRLPETTLHLGHSSSSPLGLFNGHRWRSCRAAGRKKSEMAYMPMGSGDSDDSQEDDEIEEGNNSEEDSRTNDDGETEESGQTGGTQSGER
ncbi:hypothetical protein MMC13_003057 [Lambiella insularis]|nr:hypothetical protein [Lambiella insularis]